MLIKIDNAIPGGGGGSVRLSVCLTDSQHEHQGQQEHQWCHTHAWLTAQTPPPPPPHSCPGWSPWTKAPSPAWGCVLHKNTATVFLFKPLPPSRPVLISRRLPAIHRTNNETVARTTRVSALIKHPPSHCFCFKQQHKHNGTLSACRIFIWMLNETLKAAFLSVVPLELCP